MRYRLWDVVQCVRCEPVKGAVVGREDEPLELRARRHVTVMNCPPGLQEKPRVTDGPANSQDFCIC